MRYRFQVIVVAVLLFLFNSASAEVRLDLSNEYSANSLVGLADKHFVECVIKKTNGDMVITPHFGGSLGFTSGEHFFAVATGALPIADTYTGVFTGIDPVFVLSSMPFMATTLNEARALYKAARPFYEEVFKGHNQKLLYAIPYTPTGIWANRALTKSFDFKDLKVRTYDAAGVKALKLLNAAPLQLSWVDVAPQLSTGALDAVLTSTESGISASLWDYVDYYNAIGYGVAINMTHMNQDVFQSLSSQQQMVIEECAHKTLITSWQRAKTRRERNRRILKNHGVEVVLPSESLGKRLREVHEEVLNDWLEEIDNRGKKILGRYEKMLQE